MRQRDASRPSALGLGAEHRLSRLAALAALACSGVALLAGAPTASADELRMEPIVDRANVANDVPRRGMTMDRVRASFGQPVGQRAAVGDPPIARWEYEGFVVYFEYQYVLHTVVKQRR